MRPQGRLHDAIANVIVKMLVEANYNAVRTAKLLGVSRSTVYRLMDRYELKDFRDAARKLSEMKNDDG